MEKITIYRNKNNQAEFRVGEHHGIPGASLMRVTKEKLDELLNGDLEKGQAVIETELEQRDLLLRCLEVSFIN